MDTALTVLETEMARFRVRDHLGRALYHGLSVGYFARSWDDLPDHDRERYRIAAVAFVTSAAVEAYLDALRQRIAA